MLLVGARGQQVRDLMFDASGTITSGSAPQLLLPEHKSRSYLFIQNLDDQADMYIEFGAARATVGMSGGALTTFTITNAGFGYTRPPIVTFLGGGNGGDSAWLGVAAPSYPSPGDPGNVHSTNVDMSGQRIAKAHAVLSANAVSSIVLEDVGAGYAAAPYVRLTNDLRDPFGCAIPSVGVGMRLPGGGSNVWVNGTFCPTDPVSIFCATVSAAFCVKYML